MKNIRIVVVSTTAYSEENLSLITDLTDEQIKSIIEPIVMAERVDDIEYDNDDLVQALITAYPGSFIKESGGGDFIAI